MKKIYFLTILFSLLLFMQCAMASYTRTGKKYSQLPVNTHVDVIMRAVPNYKVEQIGIVKLQGGTLNMQIEKAKKIARKNGANVIILTEVGTGISSSGGNVQTYEIRTFEVAKKIE